MIKKKSTGYWASEMVKAEKGTTTTADELSLILVTHMVEGKN